ncbi:tetratricopeptide repeat protein [Sphingomonas canadensis]|nr:tetratricopeptide repeat protein [Sphingomonas canadensis]
MQAATAGKIALAAAAFGLAGVLVFASLRDKGDAPPVPAMNASAGVTLESLEAAAKAAPQDPEAWMALGMAYFDADDYPRAVSALEHAANLAPDRARIWSVLGEARARGSERDPMPPAAVEAFRKALAIDPKDPPSRYFLAAKRDLDGDHKGAIDDWFALLADTPPGAPWETDLRRTIQQVGKLHGIDVAPRLASVKQPAPPAMPPAGASAPAMAGLGGPTADEVREAARLSPSQQNEMAQGMVARLEERLKADPKDVARWVMLMRSRMTLGEPARASAALKAAVAANPGAKAELEGQAKALGVPF